MKYCVFVQGTSVHIGGTCIEADSKEQAEAAAAGLDVSAIRDWEVVDEGLKVISVRPSEAANAEPHPEIAAIQAGRPSKEIREALRRVVDYLYEDEAEDYQTLTKAEQRGHIFEEVASVARWLDRLKGEEQRAGRHASA